MEKRADAIDMSGKLPTLLVDGVEMPLDVKAYPNASLILTDAYQEGFCWYTPRGIDPYRAALVVEKSGIVPEKSVTEAVKGGHWDSRGADGITVESRSDNFTAVLNNGGEYTIKNSKFIFDSRSDGRHVCDFNGFGAVIGAFNGAKLVMENVDIQTRGVARPAVFVDSYANVLMKNVRYKVMGGKVYPGYRNCCDQRLMVAPPWVLGLTGSARGMNAMGDCGTVTIVDSELCANQWGVISTDSGSDIVLTVIDTKIGTLGEGQTGDPYATRFGSGYGSYVIDDVTEYFYGATINVGTYAAVICGGNAVYASSNGSFDVHQHYFIPNPEKKGFVNHFGKVYPGYDVGTHEEPVFSGLQGKGNRTVIQSDGFGFMAHDWGSVTLREKTEVHSKFSTFLLKAGTVRIDVDNAVLDPGDGIVLQVMDNDDKAVGTYFDPPWKPDGKVRPSHIYGPFFNTEYNEPAGYPGIDYEAPGTAGEDRVTARIKNAAVNGDFYNASGYVGEDARPLELIFGDNARVTGRIAPTSSIHIDENGNQNTHFGMEQYYHLGHLRNRVHYNGANDISLTLEGDAVWTVRDSSLLTKLVIGADASLRAPEGKTLTVSVDGKPVDCRPGMELEGQIVLEIA